jgi:hypothetical protein
MKNKHLNLGVLGPLSPNQLGEEPYYRKMCCLKGVAENEANAI